LQNVAATRAGGHGVFSSQVQQPRWMKDRFRPRGMIQKVYGPFDSEGTGTVARYSCDDDGLEAARHQHRALDRHRQVNRSTCASKHVYSLQVN
jgi:hypothetical protein